MPTPSQIRAARGLLNWSQKDLAERAGVTEATVRNSEKEGATPNSKTSGKIQAALEFSGVIFTEDDGIKRRHIIKVLEGEDANLKMLEDLYFTLREGGGEVLIAGLKETNDEAQKESIKEHINRLQQVGISERILVEKGDSNFIGPKNWYRWIPEKYFTPIPFQLYGNKLALINWGPPQQVVIIESDLFAQTFKNLFNFAWDHAENPD